MRGRADDAGPDAPDTSELVDGILALLEEAGVDGATNDAIVNLVQQWEWKREGRSPECCKDYLSPKRPRHGTEEQCPVCRKRWVYVVDEAEGSSWEEMDNAS